LALVEALQFLILNSGGTNLRVGFIQLLGPAKAHSGQQNGDGADASGKGSRVLRQLEKAWPIGEQLKNNQAEDLFAWIGRRIAEVVQDGCSAWPGQLPEAIPLGVTFSFPMMYAPPFSQTRALIDLVTVNIRYQMPRSCQWARDLPFHQI
jgi:hexokinase